MRKILTLTAAILASFSLFAASQKVPTKTLTLPTTGLVDPWGGSFTSDHNYYLDAENNLIIYYPYSVRNSSQTTWSQTDGGGSVEIADGYASSGIFKGYTYYNAVDNKDSKNRCDALKKSTGSITTYRVTNCTGVSAYVKLGKKGDKVVMNCYEMTGDAPAASASKTTEYTDANNASVGTLSVTGLDGAKVYLVELYNEGSGSTASFYEIAFYYRSVKSVVESLAAVSVDDADISSSNLTELQTNHSITLADAYAAAPVVKFTKHVVTTYDDDQFVESDVVVPVTAELVADAWQAKTTINSVEYTVSLAKAASVTITYMAGELKLGEEVIAKGDKVAENAEYEALQLATFEGWFDDAELTSAADLTAAINADKTLYGKFTYKYAQSINIEQLILDNSTSYDILSTLGARNYATGIVINSNNALDTLNDLEKKDNRNYAYLGLKVKTSGAMLNFRLANASVVRVKFGAYKTTAVPQVSINGGAYENMTITDGVYEHTASAEELISIKTASGDAVVFKQIMIDEALADITLPAPGAYAIVLGTVTNGTLAATWEGKTDKKVNVPVGATVTLTVTPASGYKVESVTVNANPIDAVAGVYSFVMPAEAVTVSASFVKDSGTAIGNTEDAVKATKVLRDGQVLILRDGKFFNALGVEVK